MKYMFEMKYVRIDLVVVEVSLSNCGCPNNLLQWYVNGAHFSTNTVQRTTLLLTPKQLTLYIQYTFIHDNIFVFTH